MAGGGDLDDIFDPAGAEAGIIETGFHGHDRAAAQRGVVARAEAGCFVNGEAEAVAGAVEKPVEPLGECLVS